MCARARGGRNQPRVRPLTDDDEDAAGLKMEGSIAEGKQVKGTTGRDPDDEMSMMNQVESGVRPAKDVPLDEARLRQQAIGVKLRQMFDEVVSEPVPDEFLDILRRADERRAGK